MEDKIKQFLELSKELKEKTEPLISIKEKFESFQKSLSFNDMEAISKNEECLKAIDELKVVQEKMGI